MYIFLYLFLFILSIILKITLAPLFAIKDITPDLILILVIYIAYQKGRIWGVISGCLAGLCFDLLGTGLLGLSSLTKSIAAFTAGYFVSDQMERQFGVFVGLSFIVVFIHDFLYFLIAFLGTDIGFWNTLFKHIFPTTIYTVVFMIIIHLLKPKKQREGIV